MATVNNYFPKGIASEQAVMQSLISESIKIQGMEVFYIPRKHENIDLILGEDVLSKFDTAIPIEMYMNHPSWQGQTDLIQKFGLFVQEEMEFIVSKPRWLETVPVAAPWMRNGGIRPQEGDLIYDKITKNLFEIFYVDVESVYYQLSKTYQYNLKCRLFIYSSERIETGVLEIDNNGEEFTQDILNNQVELDGDTGNLMIDQFSSLILDNPPQDSTLDFSKNKELDDAGTFNVNDPFGEL